MYLVAVDDGVEAVSYHDDRLALERRPHHVLDEGVRVLVDVGGSLVHDQDLRPLEHRPSEAKQLPLPDLGSCDEKLRAKAKRKTIRSSAGKCSVVIEVILEIPTNSAAAVVGPADRNRVHNRILEKQP